MMGVTQAWVSQIEHGKITELDARVGDWTIKLA
jgi:hypothetical protein